MDTTETLSETIEKRLKLVTLTLGTKEIIRALVWSIETLQANLIDLQINVYEEKAAAIETLELKVENLRIYTGVAVNEEPLPEGPFGIQKVPSVRWDGDINPDGSVFRVESGDGEYELPVPEPIEIVEPPEGWHQDQERDELFDVGINTYGPAESDEDLSEDEAS